MRIYAGADGELTLYEDEGANFNYEKGAYSTITFTCRDQDKKLVIGARRGAFAGMLEQRPMDVIFVRPGVGIGIEPEIREVISIHYPGVEKVIDFQVDLSINKRTAPENMKALNPKR